MNDEGLLHQTNPSDSNQAMSCCNATWRNPWDGRLVSYDKGHHEEPFGTTKVGCDGLSGRVGVRSNNTFHLINS